MRRYDLSTVAPVHLVAIVLFWVVRCCHHHATQRIKSSYAIRNERRRRHFAIQVNRDVLVDEDCCCELGESKINKHLNNVWIVTHRFTVCCCIDHRSSARFPAAGPLPTDSIPSRTRRVLDLFAQSPSHSSSRIQRASGHAARLCRKPSDVSAAYSTSRNPPI